MRTLRFRTKVFLSAFAVAAASLLLATLLVSWTFRRELLAQIEANLVAEAQMTARILANEPADLAPHLIDAEADGIGRIVRSRVTFIAADGRVLGDSAADGLALARLENHGLRPEVLAARRAGIGTSHRWSTTVDAEMMYVAVPVHSGPVAIVRLALPLTDVKAQANSVVSVTALALLLALAGAGGLAWVSSHVLSRRLDELAAAARRYAAGDVSVRTYDRRNDELGSVARALDDSVQALGRRVQELASERARAEAILSGMVEGVLVVSAEGEVQIVNDAARRMLKLDASAIGRRYLELIRHPDIAAQIGAALAGQLTAGVELSLSLEPGRVFVARAAPVHAPGSKGAVLVLHDVTDFRRADRIRRDFVANVSHELRTPLTAIRGYVEALLDAAPGGDETQRFLEIIERHASRMERLVKDLLRLARLDAGQEVLDRDACDTRAIFGGVLAELLPTIEARGQHVAVDVAPEAAAVLGDGVKLHDILRNLLENASNYSPEGSAITLAATREDGHVLLRVLDEGPGIPEAHLERIFERFYRVDKARSRETGGTGLGLSIVKHLVDLHGGVVWAANRPGGGAVFTVRLDRAAVTEAPAPEGAEA
jgi:two-component system phosphate regulon sensor histidine kinase PhoR